MDAATIRTFEQALRGIEETIPAEGWKDQHDAAMLCRDLEERIARDLEFLDLLALGLRQMTVCRDRGEGLGLEELITLKNVCIVFFRIYDFMTERIKEVRDAGYTVEKSDAYLRRLDWIAEVLIPVSKHLETALFRLPAEPSSVPEADVPSSPDESPGPGAASDDEGRTSPLAYPGTNVRVKARSGPERLPDPYFETDEGPAPFDLPRPGVWKKVKTRPGPPRLPDPID